MTAAELAGKKILIVDDESDLREILKDFLEYSGASIVEAVSGSEAFKFVESEKFDAIVSDIRMSNGDGITLAGNVSNLSGEKPAVLLMTGFADARPAEAYSLGVQGYILKPFKLDGIMDALLMIFASKEKRWSREVRAVVKDLPLSGNIDDLLINHQIIIGSGGLFIRGTFPDVQVQEYVKLQLNGDLTIVGIVRWIGNSSEKNPGIGVEFVNLSESALKYFKLKIEELKPKAFIPRNE